MMASSSKSRKVVSDSSSSSSESSKLSKGRVLDEVVPAVRLSFNCTSSSCVLKEVSTSDIY